MGFGNCKQEHVDVCAGLARCLLREFGEVVGVVARQARTRWLERRGLCVSESEVPVDGLV